MEIMQIVWLVLVVVFVILEASTATLVSVWFAAGSLVALLVSLLLPWNDGMGVIAQVAAFLVVSGICLLALRPLARKLMGSKKVPTNADANIGKLAQVVTEVRPERIGRVKLEGLEWAAKSDAVLPVGSWCRVLAIEGAKVIVAPAEPEEAQAASAHDAADDKEEN